MINSAKHIMAAFECSRSRSASRAFAPNLGRGSSGRSAGAWGRSILAVLSDKPAVGFECAAAPVTRSSSRQARH